MSTGPRSTFQITFKVDSLYGPEGWYHFQAHNGFQLNFGILYFGVWIQFVKSNYM
jgi:hypothetical protein